MKRKNSDSVEDELGENEEFSDTNESNEMSDVEDEYDLEASATDSDENDSENNSNHDEEIKLKSKSELIKGELLQKYKERKGKQLYIRFPHKIPETEKSLEEKVKEFAPLVVKVHKPRQRHARFCLVDFATNEDRDETLKKLKKSISSGNLAKYVINIPRTESEDFVNELAERKIKSFENKKVKNRLKKASKKTLVGKSFTSSIIVFNLPATASVVQLHELFPNAVDIQIKPGRGKLNNGKNIGAITLPTTLDARKAIKNKLSLGGNKLLIKFDNQIKRKTKALKNGNDKEDKESETELNNKNPKLKSSDSVVKKLSKKNKAEKKDRTNVKKTK